MVIIIIITFFKISERIACYVSSMAACLFNIFSATLYIWMLFLYIFFSLDISSFFFDPNISVRAGFVKFVEIAWISTVCYFLKLFTYEYFNVTGNAKTFCYFFKKYIIIVLYCPSKKGAWVKRLAFGRSRKTSAQKFWTTRTLWKKNA